MNILLVGSGNIGFRHIQNLHRLKEIKNIYIYDIDFNQYDKFKLKIKSNKLIFLYQDLYKNLNFKLAIIATTVDHRFTILKEIINNNKNLEVIILEKILFKNKIQFTNILSLSRKNKILIYANYPRNIWNFYKELKIHTLNKKIKLVIRGKNWNMLSNISHFLSLFNFLNSSKKIELNYDKTSINVKKSPRVGYDEIEGKIVFTNNLFSELIAVSNSYQTENLISIESEDFKMKVIENKKIHLIYSKDEKRFKKFSSEKPLIFQSDLSYKILKEYIRKKNISLPTLYESAISDYAFFNLVKLIENKIKRKIKFT